jgi:purine catabolism regulator
MMRTKYMEEKTRYKQNLWVTDWLNGKHTGQEIRDYMPSIKPSMKLSQTIVCLFDIVSTAESSKDYEDLLLQKQMIARALFEGEGFYLMPTVIQDQIVFILLDQLPAMPCNERISRVIQRLQKSEANQETILFSPWFGIGKTLSDPTRVKESYETAQETIEIQKDTGMLASPFYHEQHVNKVILKMKQTGMLESFIDEYIGKLTDYDREKNGQLLKTLNVYLALCGSKQDTAKELFIVRQTLYHRLDKIAALLGDDYMHPHKRIAIELALHGYEYMHGAIV